MTVDIACDSSSPGRSGYRGSAPCRSLVPTNSGPVSPLTAGGGGLVGSPQGKATYTEATVYVQNKWVQIASMSSLEQLQNGDESSVSATALPYCDSGSSSAYYEEPPGGGCATPCRPLSTIDVATPTQPSLHCASFATQCYISPSKHLMRTRSMDVGLAPTVSGLSTLSAGGSTPPKDASGSSPERAKTAASVSTSATPPLCLRCRDNADFADSDVSATEVVVRSDEEALLDAEEDELTSPMNHSACCPGLSRGGGARSMPSSRGEEGCVHMDDVPCDDADADADAEGFGDDNEEFLGGRGMSHSQSLDNIVDMVVQAERAVLDETTPELTLEGTGGTYFVNDARHVTVGVFKPHDEEASVPGNPRGHTTSLKACIPSGASWMREIAAYRLDHAHFAGVPETFQMKMPSSYFNSDTEKIGSFQRFVKSDAESWDVLPGTLPVEDIQRIASLDIRLCNSDRHGGNVLVCRGEEGKVTHLVPIDHGCCLPTNLTELEFEWMLWSQSKQPVLESVRRYVSTLNGEQDEATLVNELGISPHCAQYVRASTYLLQRGVSMGLTMYDIGHLMRRPRIECASELEVATAEARSTLEDGGAIDFEKLFPMIDAVVAKEVQRKKDEATS